MKIRADLNAPMLAMDNAKNMLQIFKKYNWAYNLCSSILYSLRVAYVFLLQLWFIDQFLVFQNV